MSARVACLLAIFAAGCGSQLKPGFCEKDADCPAGNYCSQIQSATAWHRCFPIGDGGPPDGVQPCTTSTCSGAVPICDSTTKVCRACATGDECAAANPNTRACVSGACVQCAARTDCAAPTPACDATTNACVGCTAATASADCVAPKPACNASTNTCVECVASSDCRTKTKPICDTVANACQACASDSECPADPGICTADGHCATSGEVIHVQNSPSTCNEAGSGTAAAPLCSLQPLLPLLSATRDLVLVRGSVDGGKWNYAGDGGGNLFIVGQQNAAIASGTSPAFAIQSGSVSMRGMRLSSSASVGISAKGGVLTLDHVTVDSSMGGGILLDGAAFDIENTVVTRNGPAQQPVVWGGILVNSLPASGPKLLKLVTIQNNMAPGLFCGAGNAIQGDGVFASGNAALDVATACNVTPCMSAGPDCGAQP